MASGRVGAASPVAVAGAAAVCPASALVLPRSAVVAGSLFRAAGAAGAVASGRVGAASPVAGAAAVCPASALVLPRSAVVAGSLFRAAGAAGAVASGRVGAASPVAGAAAVCPAPGREPSRSAAVAGSLFRSAGAAGAVASGTVGAALPVAGAAAVCPAPAGALPRSAVAAGSLFRSAGPAGTADPARALAPAEVPASAERAEVSGESLGIGMAGGCRNTGMATGDDAASPRAASLRVLSAGAGTGLSAAATCVSCPPVPGVAAARVSPAVPVPAAASSRAVSTSRSCAVPAAAVLLSPLPVPGGVAGPAGGVGAAAVPVPAVDVSPVPPSLAVGVSSAVPAGGVGVAAVPVPVAAVDVFPVPSFPPAGCVAWPPGDAVPPVPALSAGRVSVASGARAVSVGSRSESRRYTSASATMTSTPPSRTGREIFTCRSLAGTVGFHGPTPPRCPALVCRPFRGRMLDHKSRNRNEETSVRGCPYRPAPGAPSPLPVRRLRCDPADLVERDGGGSRDVQTGE